MARIINDNFKVNVGNPIDSKYLASTNQPYADVAAVNTAIVESQRYVGLTVNIGNVEYWYGSGVTDGSLVIKDSGIANTGITTANNGLTKSGATVLLGGTLTGATTFTKDGTGSLLKYAAEYCGEYDARTIPDAGFVTGLTSQSINTASNGLTKTGVDVTLGGTTPLDKVTSICGADFNMNIGTAASKIGDFTVNTGNAAILASGTTDICPTGALTLDGSSILVKEAAAYDNSKAPFSALQIPDAQWVTGITCQGITSANNGVCVSGEQNVVLGGDLTGDTTIGGAHTLCLSSLTAFNATATNIVLTGSVCATGAVDTSSTLGVGGALTLDTAATGDVATDTILVRDSGGVVKEVQSCTVGITTASNGVCLDGDNFVLGGTLTGNTTVAGGSNDMTFNGLANFNATATNIGLTGAVTATGAVIGTSTLNVSGATWLDSTLRVDGATTLYSVAAYDSSKAPFSALQIPDAQWVTGITSNAFTNATNGLTGVAPNVCLGGTLSTDTIINLNNGNCIEFCDNGNNVSYKFDFLGMTLSQCSSSLQITNSGDDYSLNHCSGSNVSLTLSGLTYGGNYESNFCDNTLVTKNYVDNATGGINANNGLDRQGSNIVLGGALTGDTDISAGGTLTVSAPSKVTDVQYLDFDGIPDIPTTPTEGSLYYSACSLNFTREIAGVTLQIGEEHVVRVENNTGSGMTNGDVVYITGAEAGVPTIALAKGNNFTAARTLGLITSDIANNNEGYLTQHGVVNELNTATFSIGDTVWLAPTGGLTNTEPTYPDATVILGVVLTSDSSVGAVLVDVSYEPDHVTISEFTGYTATTNIAIGNRLCTCDFDNYTGTTETTLTGLTAISNVAITGASNGLCKVGDHDVKLGGSLSEATCIDGAFTFTVEPAQNICLATTTTKDIGINAKSNGEIYMKSQSGVVDGSDMTTAVGIQLDYNASVPMLVTDNRPTPRGLQYNDDYTASYCDRSLVDKYYVDSIATGLNVHEAVSVATTPGGGNLPLTGLTGSIDGVVISAATASLNRILVKNQTDGSENGIYSATTGDWGRTEDYDFTPAGEISNGDLVPVISGTTNANSQWINTSTNPIVSGDTITFSIFSQQQGVVGGDGITVTTVGSNKEVAVDLAPSNCGLEITGTALALDFNAFTCGLDTSTAGEVRVCASTGSTVGNAIDVKFGVSNQLIVDSSDFSYTSAANGLCKIGCNVTLGGALTADTTVTGGGSFDLSFNNLCSFALGFRDATVTDASGSGIGLQYAADYKSTFTDCSLVSKLFVTDAITGSSYLNATNGLTKSGGDICWGSTTPMTADSALLRGTTNFCMKNTGIDFLKDCSCVTVVNAQIDMRSCTTAGSLDALVQTCDTGVVSILGTAANAGVLITAAGEGAVYAGDYEGDFVPRSLVTCKYVDSVTSGITGAFTSANNGLCSSGQVVSLGGDLTGNTTVGGASTHSLTMNALTAFNVGATNIGLTGILTNTGAIIGTDKLNISGATWLDTTLRVDGTSTLAAVNASGAIVGASTLNISGATHLDGTLRVDGAATLNSVATGDVATDCILVWDSSGVVKEVASCTVGITTASNGVCLNGDNFVLGGDLTGNTTVGGAHTMAFNNTTFNVTATNIGITGILTNTGAIIGTNNLNISGTTWLDSTLRVDGATTLGGTLNASGATWLAGTARVDGALTLNSVGAGASDDALLVLDSTGVVQCITQTSLDVTANNGLCANGNKVSLGGDLTGNTTIGGASTHSLTMNALTALNVGATNIGITGILTNTGAIIGTDNLNISGNTWIDGTARIDGTLTLNSVGAGASNDAILVLDGTGAVQCITQSSLDLTAGNGLSATGNYVELGGTLTGATCINAQTDNQFSIVGQKTAQGSASIYLNEDNNLQFTVYTAQTCTGVGSRIWMNPADVSMEVNGAGSDKMMISLDDTTNNQMLVEDSIYDKGLEYAACYHDNYTARSLVDAQYVTGCTSGVAVTVNNGLCKDAGNNIRLGGALTGNTTVSGAHTMAFTNTTFNVTATNIGLTGIVTATGAVIGTDKLNITGATWLDSTLRVDGVVTLNSVASGDAETDSVLVRDSGGVVKEVSASELGEDNNIYGMTVVTSNATLTTGSTYVQLVNNASSGITLTLPSAPTDGQVFRIKDAAGAALTYPITIDRNGKLIDGAANDGILNTDGGALELVYNSSLGSWFVFSFVN